MDVQVTIQDKDLRRLLQMLSGSARKEIHRVAAYGMMVLCRSWLRREASKRHFTAHRLGATPTGHLEEAANSMLTTAEAGYEGNTLLEAEIFGY